MKRTLLFAMITAALVFAVPAAGKCQTAAIPGTWKLASYNYGTSHNFIPVPKGDQHIKLITETHFMWVETDTATRKVLSMAGGTYTLNGNTYTESIDYGIDMDSYLGHNQTFTVKVEGDLLFMSGILSDGYKVEEIWQRAK
jgi:hypothetical protein